MRGFVGNNELKKIREKAVMSQITAGRLSRLLVRTTSKVS